MRKIDLNGNERKKVMEKQHPEKPTASIIDHATLLREKIPNHADKSYIAQNPETGGTGTSPVSDHEWQKGEETDPALQENKNLLDLSRFNINLSINDEVLSPKQNRNYLATLKQIKKYGKNQFEPLKESKTAGRKKLKKSGNHKKDLEASKKNENKMLALKTKYYRPSPEHPIKHETDLGCFPQLPLLDVSKFKNIRLLLHEIEYLGQVNKD